MATGRSVAGSVSVARLFMGWSKTVTAEQEWTRRWQMLIGRCFSRLKSRAF
jgi:hypothetical protein